MLEERKQAINILAPKPRYLLTGLCFILLIVFTSGMLAIPFFYASFSIQYKFGLDRFLLRSGKIFGLLAFVLLLLQLVLVMRLKWLDRLFSLPNLYRVHRLNAFVIAILVLIHPILVLVPDDMIVLPFEFKYWPEWIGAILLFWVGCQIIISLWRGGFFKAWENWLAVHRIIAAAVYLLIFIHILFVSETFAYAGLPRNLILLIAGCIGLLWLWVLLRPLLLLKNAYIIKQVRPAGHNAYSIDLQTNAKKAFSYIPGQFAFFSFKSKDLPKEIHPFSLASSPTRPEILQVTIRRSGDWTAKAGALQKGDRAYLQGPYGRFSHLFDDPSKEIIMIAGGIGITPMLSMLRYMYDVDDPRKITLLWSNRTPGHLFGKEELSEIAHRLIRFKWSPIFTREEVGQYPSGRLVRKNLARMLDKCSRDAYVFICGPASMIKAVRRNLIRLGFRAKAIRYEKFGL